MIGFKIDDLQKTNWPWGKDVHFEINDSLTIYHRYLFLKTYNKKRNYKFDFNKLNLNSEKGLYEGSSMRYFQNCKKSLISDVDSSLIFLVNCDGTL